MQLLCLGIDVQWKTLNIHALQEVLSGVLFNNYFWNLYENSNYILIKKERYCLSYQLNTIACKPSKICNILEWPKQNIIFKWKMVRVPTYEVEESDLVSLKIISFLRSFYEIYINSSQKSGT